jgi:hypothetical protein
MDLNNYYKFNIDNKTYYCISKSNGTENTPSYKIIHKIYDETGKQYDENKIFLLDVDADPIKINRKDLPKTIQIMLNRIDDEYEKEGNKMKNWADSYKEFKKKYDKIPDNNGNEEEAMKMFLYLNKDKFKDDKKYSDMSKKELEELLNYFIDIGDFIKAKEISSYIKESLIKNFEDFKRKKD